MRHRYYGAAAWENRKQSGKPFRRRGGAGGHRPLFCHYEGESAALLLTAGTVASTPTALWGNAASGATLTIKMYTLMKEENDLTTACAIGIVLLVIVIVLNFASKMITKKLMSKKGE